MSTPQISHRPCLRCGARTRSTKRVCAACQRTAGSHGAPCEFCQTWTTSRTGLCGPCRAAGNEPGSPAVLSADGWSKRHDGILVHDGSSA